MATASIGPIGLIHRERVRAAAFQCGVATHESRGPLASTFTLRGPAEGVRRLLRLVRGIAEEEERADHRDFVADMERSERRRDRWARLFGRGRRLEPLTRAESIRALDMMEAAYEQNLHMSDEARARLRDSIRRTNDANRPATVPDAVLGTFASVGMRHLQHDLRTGGIGLAKPFKRQVLETRVTIDTWNDR